MRPGVDVAGLQDAQRGDQLLLGPVAAATLVGQRREALDHRHRAAVAAVIRLHAPDRQHHVAVDTVGSLDRRQRRGELLPFRAAGLDAGRRGGAVEIFPDRLGEFGLPRRRAARPRRSRRRRRRPRRRPRGGSPAPAPGRGSRRSQASKLGGLGGGSLSGHRRTAVLQCRVGAGASPGDQGEGQRRGCDPLQLLPPARSAFFQG